MTIAPGLYNKLGYDPMRDFTPVSLLLSMGSILAVNNEMPVKSFQQSIALARAQPGKLNKISPGVGTPQHVGIELLKIMAGLDITHVPYKGMAAANIDVITGQVQLGFPSMTSVLPHVKAGKLKAFAITVNSRSALAPSIPTMDEAGVPGYEASIWNGLLAPAGTSRPIVNRLNESVVRILKSPQAQERYAAVGAEIRYNSPEEFHALIRSEIAKWSKVVKAAGIRADQL